MAIVTVAGRENSGVAHKIGLSTGWHFKVTLQIKL